MPRDVTGGARPSLMGFPGYTRAARPSLAFGRRIRSNFRPSPKSSAGGQRSGFRLEATLLTFPDPRSPACRRTAAVIPPVLAGDLMRMLTGGFLEPIFDASRSIRAGSPARRFLFGIPHRTGQALEQHPRGVV